MLSEPWQDRVAARQRILASQIPPEWRVTFPSVEEVACVYEHGSISTLLAPSEVEITTAPTVELVDKLQTGQLTAEATVTAFCKRAALAHQALNCATDIFFDEAIQTAKEYDHYRESTGKTKGPLHGLPVSIKDAFDIAGHITTSGLVSRLDNVTREDTLLVAILREAGAIPFVKTNISQGCLLVESTNNIYGTVLNPWNRNLSAGGSSGGEGALVAFRGSPLGVGTDGGGSLRIPAAWNGIYTLKPTAARIPGFPGGAGRSTSNSANNGPLAWDIDTVELFCDVVLSYKPWLKSPSVMPLPWVRGVKAPARLKLGFLFDDGIVHFAPPVTRCLREAAKLLGDTGHEIVELGPDWADLHRRAAGVAFTMYTEEGGIGLREELEKSGEPLVPRVCTGWSEQPLTPSEIWANHRRRNALATEYLRKFQLEDLDAIVTAPMPHPAPPHGEYITSAICAAYNALDVPVCCVPFGRVDLQKDIAPTEWYELTPYDDMPNFPYDRYDRDMKKLYKGPEVFENAPLGLQIVGLPFQEESCLAVARSIDSVLQSH